MTIVPAASAATAPPTGEPHGIESVERLLLQIEKTLRATQLYLPNNPMHQAALDRLANTFREYWDNHDDLVLQITGVGFEYHGTTFPNDIDHPDGFAWLLYRDGLRTLSLAPGCEDEEFSQLLRLVEKARANARKIAPEEEPTGHDDLLTMLWPEEFRHIHYEFVEAYHEDYLSLDETGTDYNIVNPADVCAQIEEDIDEDAQTSDQESNSIANLEDFESTLHFLDEREIEQLRQEIDQEYQTELHDTIVAILFDIFETQTFDDPQEEVASIFEELIPHFLALGKYRVVADILREVRGVSLPSSAPPEAAQRLDDVAATLSSPEVLNGVLQMLDDAHVTPSRHDLSELLGQLQPRALGTVLEWLPKTRASAVRGALSLALDPIVRSEPKRLAEVLGNLGPAATVAALEVVGRLGLRSFAADVVGFSSHDDKTVRKAAALTLADLGTPETLQALIHLLVDDNRDVRLAAASKLAAVRHVAACPALEEVIVKRLRGTPLSEKRVFFEAFAILSGETGVTRLDTILNAKRFLRRRDDADTRACAAMALGVIATPKANEALRRAVGDKEPIVRNAIEKAIRRNDT